MIYLCLFCLLCWLSCLFWVYFGLLLRCLIDFVCCRCLRGWVCLVALLCVHFFCLFCGDYYCVYLFRFLLGAGLDVACDCYDVVLVV